MLEPLWKKRFAVLGKWPITTWYMGQDCCGLLADVLIFSATEQSMINILTLTPHRHQDPVPGADPVPVWGLHVHLCAGVDPRPHPQGFPFLHRETGIHSSRTHLCRIYGQWISVNILFHIIGTTTLVKKIKLLLNCILN